MFEPERDRKNDLYGWIDNAAPELLRASRELVENNEAYRVSDQAVAQILTAAIRLYVAKSDGEERTFPTGRRKPLLSGHRPEAFPLRAAILRVYEDFR